MAPASVLVLRGPNLQVETANTRVDGFPGGTQAIGRALAELCTSPELQAVLDGARRAFQEDHRWVRSPISLPLDGGSKQVVFSVVPTHDEAGRVSGVVLYGHQVG